MLDQATISKSSLVESPTGQQSNEEFETQTVEMIKEFMSMSPEEQDRLGSETPPRLIRRSLYPELGKAQTKAKQFAPPEFKLK